MAYGVVCGGASVCAMGNAAAEQRFNICKRLYAILRMVEDLPRGLFNDAELGADYGVLECRVLAIQQRGIYFGW